MQLLTKWIGDLQVTKAKVAADAIDASKMLLSNNTTIRWLDDFGNPYAAIKFFDDATTRELRLMDNYFSILEDGSQVELRANVLGMVALFDTKDGSVSSNSGGMIMRTGKIPLGSAMASGELRISTGVNSGSGDSGNLFIFTGSTVSGVRGYLSLDGSYITVNSKKITNVTDPTDAQDAATKAYVDNIANGIKWKNAVKAATTAAITLANEQTIDTVPLVDGDRVLVKNQGTTADDGIYVVKALAAWVRAADAPQAGLSSAAVFVEDGSANIDKAFVQTSNTPTTSQTWVQFGGVSDVTNYDSSIAVYNGREIAVNLATNSGLEISSGLKAKVDGTTIVNTAGTLGASRSAIVRNNKEFITLTATDISNKYVTLANTPLAFSVELHAKGSITGDEGTGAGYDYHVSTNTINWSGNDLEALLAEGDIICVRYNY